MYSDESPSFISGHYAQSLGTLQAGFALQAGWRVARISCMSHSSAATERAGWERETAGLCWHYYYYLPSCISMWNHDIMKNYSCQDEIIWSCSTINAVYSLLPVPYCVNSAGTSSVSTGNFARHYSQQIELCLDEMIIHVLWRQQVISCRLLFSFVCLICLVMERLLLVSGHGANLSSTK